MTNKDFNITQSTNCFGGESPEDILSFLLSDGTINWDDVAESMKKSRKEQILKQYHTYAITESTDGRYRTYISDDTKPKGRKQIVRVNRDDLIDYLVDYYTVKKSETLNTLFERWITWKSERVESSTIKRVRADYTRYYANTDIVNIPLNKLTDSTLDSWIHKLIKDFHLNKHQYLNCTLIIRQELDYAVREKIIPFNPWLNVRVDKTRLKGEKKKADSTQVYTPAEKEKFFNLAWNDYNEKAYPVNQLIPLACMFLFCTGLRVGEVVGIRYEDLYDNTLIVRRNVRENGEVVENTKGAYGERKVLLIPQALELINAARERQLEEGVSTSGYIFSMTDKPVLYTSQRKAFYKYSKKIGIPPKSSHKARKTFVSSLIDENVNINTIRELVGHKDEKTTFNNYCYNRSTTNEIIKQMETALS